MSTRIEFVSDAFLFCNSERSLPYASFAILLSDAFVNGVCFKRTFD